MEPTTEVFSVSQCGYQARAWLGEQSIADSHNALRADAAERDAVLWFPIADVAADALGDQAVGATKGVGQFAGYVSFDAATVRQELVDPMASSDPRAETIKPFPNWGDAAHLIEMIDVIADGELRYVSAARADWRRPVVEASQILGQCVVAAMRHTGNRRVVASSLISLRVADSRLPMTFDLEVLSNGRTLSTIIVRVEQNARLCATATLLLDETSDDAINHHVEPPAIPGPYDCPTLSMGVTGRDVRVVDNAYSNDPHAPLGPPVIDAWVRFASVADDPALHAGLLAQFTGHMAIAAALRPHPGIGQSQAHVTLSSAINVISLSIHRQVRADEWMLYHHHSTSANGGMTHAECRVHNIEGHLLASFSVDAMVRPFAHGATGSYQSSL